MISSPTTGFKVLSIAERTATIYSLLQHSTQVQIRFFIAVLQQVARADPMTALLTPAVGVPMQSQMEAKLASMNLKSPGLKSNMPSSPSARTFNTSATNRQPLAFDSSSPSSPDSTNSVSNPSDVVATLAQAQSSQQRRSSHIGFGSRLKWCRRTEYMGRRQFTWPGHGAR